MRIGGNIFDHCIGIVHFRIMPQFLHAILVVELLRRGRTIVIGSNPGQDGCWLYQNQPQSGYFCGVFL